MENLTKLLNNKRSLRRVINNMTFEEAENCLLKFQKIVEERREENAKNIAQQAEKERIVSELREKMVNLGISIADLGVSSSRSSKKGIKAPAKYEWHDDQGIIRQWTGRGIMPLSLKAKINEGNKSLDDFLIK